MRLVLNEQELEVIFGDRIMTALSSHFMVAADPTGSDTWATAMGG